MPPPKSGNFFSYSLDGARELEKSLMELPKAVAKGVLRQAAQKAMRPVLDAALRYARSRVRVRTGRFANSFIINTKLTERQQRNARRYGGLGNVNVYVGSTDPKAHLIEFGTHDTPAHPVMRPAWEENKEEVFKLFCKNITQNLVKAARRLATRAIKGTLSAKERQSLR